MDEWFLMWVKKIKKRKKSIRLSSACLLQAAAGINLHFKIYVDEVVMLEATW